MKAFWTVLTAGTLLLGGVPGWSPPSPLAQSNSRFPIAAHSAGGESIDLLRLRPAVPQRGSPRLPYPDWLSASGWEDRRPFSASADRFRIENGVLRLESRGDSFLIGRDLPPDRRPSLLEYPYLRFTVRIARVPRGARLAGESRDDSAFRIYAVFNDRPLRALAYAWSWDLPVGHWSVRGRSLWGDFRQVHRKSFGRGVPRPDTWLMVEVDLRRDFRARFDSAPPRLIGVGLKTDSNHTPGAGSLAWLKSIELHRVSLRDRGYREGSRLGWAVVWFR